MTGDGGEPVTQVDTGGMSKLSSGQRWCSVSRLDDVLFVYEVLIIVMRYSWVVPEAQYGLELLHHEPRSPILRSVEQARKHRRTGRY